MAGQSNAAPVVIKRKKVVQGGGHHGGAWKVAYADFVTAMMAFFMLMWLLNATTEKQRKGLADYFNPTIPMNRVSGGGEGAFGGNSVFHDQTMTQTGTGAANDRATAELKASGETGQEGADAAEQKQLEEVEKMLKARSGESMTMQRLLRHVVTRITDEGLVIEIFDLPDVPLFFGDTDQPEAVLPQIARLLAEILPITTNRIAVNGHMRSYPITLIRNPVWDISAARAQRMRGLLESEGLPGERMQRVSGFADRKIVTPDPMAVRNNRLEVILLRRDR
ncbi:MotB2 [Cereibacter sphaeroides WS8N]|jgi:chemotaxis protein MotB|uniref:flagellar motor protein MotB n=1 Tax=Cereibacter sphaeroides TaxID=1063 RepID=UPI000066416C|nr:flagellar motor protein MotB [Cereibacter sphaeroides]ABN78064.1 putative chemotaxis MotB protein [Cereibacter sphaeroides ATCC 17029]EGJ22806.1 MotB2 [Cereibacter sphaeroides WS8N]